MIKLTNHEASKVLAAATKGVRAAFARYGRSDRNDDVLDLAQTAMINVIEKFDSTKSANVEGFAYRIGYNEALDCLRGAAGTMAVTRGAREGFSLNHESGEDGEETDMLDSSIECADQSPLVDAQMERNEFLTDLHEAINDLPEGQREVIKASLAGDDHLDGARRVAKTRAIKALREMLA